MINQDDDYKWFEENKSLLFKQFPHKQLVISDKNVIGVFDNLEEALTFALSKLHAGEFIIQECTNVDNNAYYYNHAVMFI